MDPNSGSLGTASTSLMRFENETQKTGSVFQCSFNLGRLAFAPSSFTDVEQPQTYIVQVFKSDKLSNFASHHEWYHSAVQSLPASPHPQRIIYTYTDVVDGFAARLTPSQANHLRNLPGIISIHQERIHKVHTTRTPRFLGLSNYFGLWPESNYADDVVIGVLDTGIWPESRSFSDIGLSKVPARWKGTCEIRPDFPEKSCNRKIIGAKSLYHGSHKAAIHGIANETGKRSTTPRDTQGHGTHIASTVAGSSVKNASLFDYAVGEAKGMATRARIAVYKICWVNGCFDSDILASFDQAVADGVDVISVSVGTSGLARQYNEDPIALGAFGAMGKGIPVSCAAGNDGPDPETVRNIAPWILTVAASTLDREFPADVILGDGRVFHGVSLYSGEPLPQGYIELVYAGDAGNKYCLEGEFNSTTILAGKLIVCIAGDNGGASMGNAVKIAGGVGMIVVNIKEWGRGVIPELFLIPAAEVSYKDGARILKYMKSQKKSSATIKFRGTVTGGSPSAPKVAAFSSRGPNSLAAEILKPDITAPGVNILAAWTGAVAPTSLDMDPRRSILLPVLQRHALTYNLGNSGKNITDIFDGRDATPFDVGSGHLDPNRALHPGLIYDLVPTPRSVKIKVSPRKPVFSNENRTLSYKITFSSLVKGAVLREPEFGSIEWRDGVHVVTSAIAFTWTTTKQ
ncbi:hypothetical protein C5167_041593 [Papaver somniferum]|nr:hypothetical protein C5167_041593 [Papaver somniferum]